MAPPALHLLALATLAQAVSFDCARVRTGGVNFDLSKLGGPHSVSWVVDEPPSISNTTFTLDICQPLKKDSGLQDGEQCPGGTRVCAVERDTNTVENSTQVRRVIPIAGDFTASHGRALDPKITRMKNSASNSDAEKEGIRVEFNGGKYPEKSGGRTQRAIVQFECDKDRTGNEEVVKEEGMVERREEKEGDKDGDKEGDKDKEDDGKDEDKEKDRSLTFVSYKAEDEVDVLRLNWRTKYACEEVPADDDEGNESKGWGFFGWLFIIVFLGAAAYLIFGSWLNYTRYGARGWDLVPHGDTIRDMPYLISDWGRSVKDTLQGRGYRGGYSAV
ncbi:hypothetical protein K461DRAFT_282899 [Myriangium duriaei CBS 260.36]|uniref:Autophagy-related protein 27 n=1 Tax=Myriangium duriaei CBS 260.36 TaxID=1168546 RepID=A0A9P4IXA1_9PEZI|nr:hypothetical protein K461DRAFT_282899 [Myriangium duriaei CBS 260.36]